MRVYPARWVTYVEIKAKPKAPPSERIVAVVLDLWARSLPFRAESDKAMIDEQEAKAPDKLPKASSLAYGEIPLWIIRLNTNSK